MEDSGDGGNFRIVQYPVDHQWAVLLRRAVKMLNRMLLDVGGEKGKVKINFDQEMEREKN